MPWPRRTSTCRSFVTISSGLCRLVAIVVLLHGQNHTSRWTRPWGQITFAFRVHARDAGAGLGVLDETVPVPGQNTGIKLVVEDAGACIGIASDGRVDPRTVARTRNPLEGEVLT